MPADIRTEERMHLLTGVAEIQSQNLLCEAEVTKISDVHSRVCNDFFVTLICLSSRIGYDRIRFTWINNVNDGWFKER